MKDILKKAAIEYANKIAFFDENSNEVKNAEWVASSAFESGAKWAFENRLVGSKESPCLSDLRIGQEFKGRRDDYKIFTIVSIQTPEYKMYNESSMDGYYVSAWNKECGYRDFEIDEIELV